MLPIHYLSYTGIFWVLGVFLLTAWGFGYVPDYMCFDHYVCVSRPRSLFFFMTIWQTQVGPSCGSDLRRPPWTCWRCPVCVLASAGLPHWPRDLGPPSCHLHVPRQLSLKSWYPFSYQPNLEIPLPLKYINFIRDWGHLFIKCQS